MALFNTVNLPNCLPVKSTSAGMIVPNEITNKHHTINMRSTHDL